jgi:tetratricopeptide (TPR) repeat protein
MVRDSGASRYVNPIFKMLSSTRLTQFFIFSLTILLFLYCTEGLEESNAQTFQNLQPNVQYMGMQTCRSCHNDIHETFIHTGMGRSFDHATLTKTDASFGDHALIYDDSSDFYYFPFFEDSTMYVTEFRLENGDTTHQRTEKIDYIIGSGQHTNSHILNFSGYIFQAPVTYYTQDEKWDMAPGFRNGGNLRFARYLTTECITCHNHFPKFEKGSLNKYAEMPTGIECERCHGPGEIHVKEKLAGKLVDTSKYVDYTIVNPRHLSRDLQMDLCQRCHLQGIAVLNDEKSFFDFKPGMKLNEILNVFLPRYTNSHEKFIMASQADRLRLSECYLNSEMSCITCHNPHKSIEVTGQENFNQTCLTCHKSATDCSVSENERLKENNNCVGCHMPKSGSIDIPHVNITDHFISKNNTKLKKPAPNNSEEARFLGLQILTKEKATPLEMAKGYLAIFDKYVQSEVMLDSAEYYLNQSPLSFEEKFKTSIHYHFTREDYQSIIQIAPKIPTEKIKDEWTAYRIGQAYFNYGNFKEALKYFQKAVEFSPLNLEFREKLGNVYFNLNQIEKSKSEYEFVLSENEKRPIALCNLGYIHVLREEIDKGEKLIDKAISLDPDYEQALLNKAAILFIKKQNEEGRTFLKRILKINPQNEKAKLALSQFQ